MWCTRIGIGLWVVLALSSTASAQTWSSEQQEVWKAVDEMILRFASGDVERAFEFVHPDIVWWNSANDVPGGYDAGKRHDTMFWQNARRRISHDCVPLTIQVYDTFAVVNAFCRDNLEPRAGEDPEWSTLRLHLVMKKEGSRWLQIANYLDLTRR